MSPSQRRSPRVNVTLAADWIRRDRVTRLCAVDINRDGMFLRTTEEIPVRSLMQLQVILPDGRYTLMVAVRFAGTTDSGHGLGVEIVVATNTARNAWTRFYTAMQRRAVVSTSAQVFQLAV